MVAGVRCEKGTAKTDRNPQAALHDIVFSITQQQARFLNCFTDDFRESHSPCSHFAAQDNSEFFATIPSGQSSVISGQRCDDFLNLGSERAKYLIANQMSVSIIELLEMIDVEQDKAERFLGFEPTINRLIEKIVKGTPVCQACQTVFVRKAG